MPEVATLTSADVVVAVKAAVVMLAAPVPSNVIDSFDPPLTVYTTSELGVPVIVINEVVPLQIGLSTVKDAVGAEVIVTVVLTGTGVQPPLAGIA